jgi:acyl-CoA synthetase (AMP-forming)/AMP-acid ligase II
LSGTSLPDTILTVPDTLAYWAEQTPEAPALIRPDCPAITYGALWQMASALAASLSRAGLGPSDRVVLLVPEGPELAIALLGTTIAAMAIPISSEITPAELDATLGDLAAAAAIVMPALAETSRACLGRRGLPIWELCFDAGMTELTLDSAPAWATGGERTPRPEDIAVVLLTSGTTGEAKRVPNTHRAVVTIGRARRDQFGLCRFDRALAVAPLTLSLGLCVLFHTLVAGAAVIFPPTFDLPALWTTLVAERATWMFPSAGLTEVLTRFLRGRPTLSRPPALRFVRITAAPIAAAVCDELERRLGVPVLPSYSTTETGLIATALPLPARHPPGSVGRPILDLRIVGPAGDDLAPGATGEIWVRGDKLFAGYLDDPERNAAVLRPGGWFRTGDIGHQDEEGFLFLTGRLSELVNRGGAKIAPAEVDAVLTGHPAVRAAATFGVPDERLGEDLVAAVVLEPGRRASARELRTWMLAQLSPHKVPRRLWFVSDLPRTELGKVQRSALSRLWQGRPDLSG